MFGVAIGRPARGWYGGRSPLYRLAALCAAAAPKNYVSRWAGDTMMRLAPPSCPLSFAPGWHADLRRVSPNFVSLLLVIVLILVLLVLLLLLLLAFVLDRRPPTQEDPCRPC